MVKDEKSAVMLLESNMNDLEPDGLLLLAKCYAFGRGTTPNRMGAEDLIQRAAEMESEEALLLTLTKLNLWGAQRNNTQMASINNLLFSVHIKSTDNDIGERGVASLSDALKSNTTLIELNLWSEHKKKQHTENIY